MKTEQFKKLSISDNWWQYLISYPNGFTIYENLIDWVSRTNAVIKNVNDWNEYLEEFVKAFDKELQEKVVGTLSEWQESGFLDIVIDAALQTQIDKVEESLNDRAVNLCYPPAPLVGAKGDGVTDDTAAIQAVINYANSQGIFKVFVPSAEKEYLFSEEIQLNGCSLIGVDANLYNTTKRGAVFKAADSSVIGISQGSTSTEDIQFNVKNIVVKDAKIGFNFDYVINSRFERLYAINCDVGFKLGDPSKVGSMFCEFNHLWTQDTRIGILSQSKEFFNNNIFNNGYITGTEKAMHLEVSGGYGAVNNVFNNVEFRSPMGRGITMSNCTNTIFNHCYFENGANAIRALTFCTFTLNDCVFGVFRATNNYTDKEFIYSVGGVAFTVNGGTIFLTEHNIGTLFYRAGNPVTHDNVLVIKQPRLVGREFAPNFEYYAQRVPTLAVGVEEQVTSTSTQIVPAGGYLDVNFTYDKPFSKIPEICTPTLRGAGYQAYKVYWILSEKLSTGGTIRVYNDGTEDRQISFTIHAKTLAN